MGTQYLKSGALRLLIVVQLLSMAGVAMADPAVGDKVRVEHDGQRVAGLLKHLDTRSVVLETDGETVTIPVAEVSSFEVSTGRKGHALTGALVGTATGVLVGVIAKAADEPATDDTGAEIAEDVLGTGEIVILGVAGGLTGALVGHFIKSDRWSETPLSGMDLGLVPQSGGSVQVGFTWATRF